MQRAARIGGAAAIAAWALLLAAGRPGLAWTAGTAGLVALSLSLPISATWQILAGAALGAALGAWDAAEAARLGVVGRVFIAMLKMLIAPMILFSIAAGVASMGGLAAVGRLGLRTFALYLATMAVAVATGLVLVNAIEPGAGGALRESAFFAEAVGGAAGAAPEELRLGEFLLRTVFQVLTNPFASLAEGRILPIVVFALLMGVALLRIGEQGRPVIDFLRAANAAVMWAIGAVLRLAPVGIFALIAHLVATVGFASLVENLAPFAAVVIAGTLFHAAVTLPLFALAIAGVGPLALWRGIREALIVAFSTSSSAATLPVTTRCVEEGLGVRPRVSSLVLPLGATVNMDGTALYEAIAALFVAHVYGIELSLGAQLVVFLVAMVTAVGAPGIPSAGMVTMIVVLESVGLPAESVGILLAIDRFLDTFRTMANVEGDAVVALCVDRLETRD